MKYSIEFIRDGFDSETNTVYEFFGDYWHGNPEIFSRGEKNSHNGKTFGQLYDETKARVSRLEEVGYKVRFVWENDFNNGLMFSKNRKLLV